MPRGARRAGGPEAPRPRRETIAAWIALAVVLAFVVLVRINLLEIPLERDEGAYAYFGQLLLDGAVPYRSFYEIKPPGLYYAYALLLAVFGDSLRGLHGAFLCVNAATAVLVFLAGLRLLSPLGGAGAAAGFALLSLIPRASGFTAQSEHLVALFVAASLLALAHALERGRAPAFAASGALAAAACTIKQTALPFVLCFLVVAVLAGRPRRLRSALAFAGGVAALYAAMLALVAAQGAFAEFWFWTHEFPMTYATRFDLAFGVQRFVRMFTRIGEGHLALWGLVATGLLAAPFAGLGRGRTPLLWLLALASFGSLFPGLRFYPHYALQMMPAAALLIGVALEFLRRVLARRAGWREGRAALGAAAVLAVAVLVTVAWQRDYYFAPDPVGIIRHVYGNNPFPEAKVVGDFIRENSEPGDTIVAFGSEPEVYFYSRRRCPSRHAYFEYTVTAHPRQPEWQAEFIRDVEAARPRYLVHFQHRLSLGGDVDARALRSLFEWFQPFANRHYRVIGVGDAVGGRTEWVWGPGAETRRNVGEYAVYVLERVAGAAPPPTH